MPKKSEKKPVITRKQKLATMDAGMMNVGAAASSSTTVSHSTDIEYLDPPFKSEIDANQYRAIKLPNGLKALLIAHRNILESEKEDPNGNSGSAAENDSDRISEDRRSKESLFNFVMNKIAPGKAACRLTIDVGSFSDPPEVPCISRLLMCAITSASKKYPLANSLEKYVNNCGGILEAVDQHEITQFFLQLPELNFRDGLDRFANCFIEPLLRQDAIDAERRCLEKDDQCSAQSLKVFAGKEYLFGKIASNNKQHPGNRLGPNYMANLRNQSNERVYEEVEKFMKRHYSAHRMTVVIEGRIPLDTLEKYAKTYFSKIPNNELPPIDFTRFSYDRCFDVPEFRMIYQMKTSILQGDYSLELNWPMPPAQRLYRSKPQNYIAWLLNHKGSGTLASYLKKKNWCTNVVCGIGKSKFDDNSVYSLLSLSITLKKEGYENRKQVLDAVYSYINLLRREGPQQRIWDEIRKIADTEFRFDLMKVITASCVPVCNNMHLYPSYDYLRGNMLYFEYDPIAIEQCLNLLSPEKANVIVYDQNFANRKLVGKEWEDEANNPVHYRRTTIAHWIDNWKTVEPLPEFHLPEANAVLDDDFEPIPPPENPSQYPEKIYSDELSEVYFKADTKFRPPTCSINHCYCSPLPMTSAENAVMLCIYARILKHLSNDVLYSAVVAGLSYHIDAHERGLLVQVVALNKKGPVFMEMIATIVAKLWNEVTKQLFDTMKRAVTKVYQDEVCQPGKLAEDLKLGILRPVRWTSLEKYTACSAVNFIKFKEFAKHYNDRLFVVCLVQGNMRKSDVVPNVKACIQKLNCMPLIPNSLPRTRLYEIPPGTHCCRFYYVGDSSSPEIISVTNHYQFPAKSFKHSALIDLLINFMVNPCFAAFRTRDKLEKMMILPGKDVFGKHGYSLCVNTMTISGTLTVASIEKMIEKYRKALNKVFKQMTDKDWSLARKIFTELRKNPYLELQDEVLRNWMEIGAFSDVFHRTAGELAALEKLSIKDLRREMMNLTSTGPNIRKLTVQSVGPKEAAQNSSCPNENSSSRNRIIFLSGTSSERVENPSDYFITDIDAFKRNLETFPISGEISARTDKN